MNGKRTLPPTYVFLALLVMVGLHFLMPVATVIAWPWRLVGIGPLVTGVIINVIADRAFQKAGTTVKPFQQSSALITSGVYRFSRHPMYLGIVLTIVGIACLMGSLAPFAVIPFLALLLDRRFIRIEERMLEERFDEAWLQYKARVRRWI
ncbi:MAG: isoprenylcysteine carboxylmethyltransferase family protein [Gemmatimonadota bacterium]|nr:MAG: isoprenylcysteine carboxylmethyltransferase family protein [Gemmatimonadota bacterium]